MITSWVRFRGLGLCHSMLSLGKCLHHEVLGLGRFLHHSLGLGRYLRHASLGLWHSGKV